MNTLDEHIRYLDNIPFNFFEELNEKYSMLGTFNLNWKCNLFREDISLVTFMNVKTFKLELEDEYNDEPATPPFEFPILETFVLKNIHHLIDEWINFVTKLTTIKSLCISTMFDGSHGTINDEVIARIAQKPNFKNGWAFESFGNIFTMKVLENFIENSRN